jgi:SAM-dependent methyltransferase
VGITGKGSESNATVVDLRSMLTRPPADEVGGVMNFISDSGADYCANFGDQWQRFRNVQIDSLSGSKESRDRFFRETDVDSKWLAGKLVLDAGCGAGRFSEIAMQAGASVVAVDLSDAVHACRRTLSQFPADRFMVVRANLFDLPLPLASFDLVFSLGVLQHTPDPLRGVVALAKFVRAGGRLSTWIYERRKIDVVHPKYVLRRLTHALSNATKLSLAKLLVTVFFPAGWLLSRFGGVCRKISFFLPYAARHHERPGNLYQQWLYSVLDTYDWLGPLYDQPQTEIEVSTAMKTVGMVNIRRLPVRGMAIVGDAPCAVS